MTIPRVVFSPREHVPGRRRSRCRFETNPAWGYHAEIGAKPDSGTCPCLDALPPASSAAAETGDDQPPTQVASGTNPRLHRPSGISDVPSGQA
jgi:hypothetical protein